MNLRFQAPKGTDGISIDNNQFDADLEGIIEAPIRFREKLLEHGFKVMGPAPEKEKKGK